MKSKVQNDAAPSAAGVSIDRRGFLGGAGAAAALGVVGAGAVLASGQARAGGFVPRPTLNPRGTKAIQLRVDRAYSNLASYVEDAHGNLDEPEVGNFAACYSKGLPHDALGEVNPAAYAALRRACLSNLEADWAAVPMGGTMKQVSPQSAIAYQLEGADPMRLRIDPAPKFSSEQRGAEMAEVYWMALLRDVPFAQYANHPLAAEAVADLRRFALFRDLTVQNLFRGTTAGERVGPYLSQFLLKDVPFGPMTITQKYAAGLPGVDFMTTTADCLSIQNGIAPTRPLLLDAPHYARNGRDLSEYVHRDFSYQAFLNAALILLGLGGGALDDGNPYKSSANRAAFVTMGGPDVLSMVAQVAVLALKAAWFQKWTVNRTLRPEAFGLRVHQDMTHARAYPIHGALLSSPVLGKLFSANGSYLLPMAYTEGSPTHPSYPAGHATIAGACVTVLKWFFKESFVLPNPVVGSDDGSSVTPYAGALTVGGELDKLAANIAIGRNIAGVHYWSDGIQGMYLGEQVALAFLADQRVTYHEGFAGFSLNRFDGSTVTI